MPLYVLAIGMTIVANVGYHLCQKLIHADISPAATLVGTYAVALVLSLCLWPWLGGSDGLLPELRKLGAASYGLGVCVVVLEMGFLLAYRAGWDIGVATLYSNAAVALLLLPIGLWGFSEGMDGRRALGLLFAFVGLVLLSGRSDGSPSPEPAKTIQKASS